MGDRDRKDFGAGMVFGPDGKSITKMGGMAFAPNGTYMQSGDSLIGPNGSMGFSIGKNMATLPGGGTVTKLGNMFYGPKGAYSFSGGMLVGPDGKTWMNVSEADVMVIIDGDK